MSKLYQYLAISLLATVIGFFAGLFFVPVSIINIANAILMVFMLIMLIGAWIVKLMKKKRGSLRFPIWVVYVFAFVEGALLYPTLMYYLASLGTLLFAEIVIGTMLIFAVMSFIGQKEEAGKFAGLGKILSVTLTVMIIVSLVNMFLHVDMINTIISAVGIVVFTLYIMVDINQFKAANEAGYINDSSDYSIYVLNVYLDIINLLLDLLNFINKLKK